MGSIAREEFYQSLREASQEMAAAKGSESDRDFLFRVLDKNNDGFLNNEEDDFSERVIKIAKAKTGKEIGKKTAMDIIKNKKSC